MIQITRRTIRILHIVGGLGSGGTERQLLLVIKHLDPRRYEHHILVLNPSQNELNSELKKMGAHIWDMPQNKASPISRLFFIVRVARSIQPEVIHSWTFYANLYAGLGGWLAKVRQRIGSHRSAGVHYTFLPGIYGWVTSRTLKSMVVNSRATIRQLQHDDTLKVRIVYIPNMVENNPPDSSPMELKLCDIRPDSILAGTIGNLRHMKNHLMFIEGIAKLTTKWNIQGVIVGQIVQTEMDVLPLIQKKILDLGMQDNIYYCGYRTDISSLLQRFDIFCLTSDYEGMPNVVLEAMAAGKPIVATRVGDVPDLVQDGINGLLVDVGDVEAFSRSVEHLLSNPHLMQQMGEAGQKAIRTHHSPQVVIRHLDSLYSQSSVD